MGELLSRDTRVFFTQQSRNAGSLEDVAQPNQPNQPPERSEPDPSWIDDFTDFVFKWWLAVVGVIGLLAIIFAVGFGFGQQWGAPQWGPSADWLVGGLTLSAVVVALRESLRGQRSRLVDHELTRRRENLKALSDVWAAIAVMGLLFHSFTDYLQNLPERFNPNIPRTDNVPPDIPGTALAHELSVRVDNFMTKWVQTIEPPIFYALAILKGTPLDEPVKQLNEMIRATTMNSFPQPCVS